jgi:hypothetical protein
MRRSVLKALLLLVTATRVAGLILLPLLLFAWAESYFHDEIVSAVRDFREGSGAGERIVRQVWSVRSARGGVNLSYRGARNVPHYAREMLDRDRAERGTWRWDRGIPKAYPMVNHAPADRSALSPLGIDWRGWGADTVDDGRGGSIEMRSPGLTFPYWLATLIVAVFVVPWLIRTRRLRRRRKLGLCLTCGYDLHGTPDRCPECGTVPPRAGRLGNCMRT